jgi:cbb3-type cytochrome oxidase maturation protein
LATLCVYPAGAAEPERLVENLLMLIPVALGLGLVGLIAFLWAMKSGQFDDLDGAAHRILFDDDDQPQRKG